MEKIGNHIIWLAAFFALNLCGQTGSIKIQAEAKLEHLSKTDAAKLHWILRTDLLERAAAMGTEVP